MTRLSSELANQIRAGALATERFFEYRSDLALFYLAGLDELKVRDARLLPVSQANVGKEPRLDEKLAIDGTACHIFEAVGLLFKHLERCRVVLLDEAQGINESP